VPRIAPVHLILIATIVAWSLNLSAVKLLTGMLDIALVAAVRMVVAAGFLLLILRRRVSRFEQKGGVPWWPFMPSRCSWCM
jgi:peptidoglycan biosynthesis protein MviN/MurJ (putative lipid II flippase)